MKCQVNLSLDVEVVVEARSHIPNLSIVVDNYLKEYLEIKRNSTDNTDDENLRNELIKMKAKASDMEMELEKKKKKELSKRTVSIEG